MKEINKEWKAVLRFWGCNAEEYLAIVLAIVAIISGIFYFVMPERGWNVVLAYLPFYFIFSMAMVVFISAHELFLSLALSFGSSRKHAFYGLQFMNLLLTLQTAAIVFLYGSLYKGVAFGRTTNTVIGAAILLSICGLRALLFVVYTKFETAAKLILGVFSGGCGAVFGFLSFMVGKGEISILDHIGNGNMVYMVLFMGSVILYAVGALLNYRVLQKYEVKV